jgi:hypothetical protein
MQYINTIQPNESIRLSQFEPKDYGCFPSNFIGGSYKANITHDTDRHKQVPMEWFWPVTTTIRSTNERLIRSPLTDARSYAKYKNAAAMTINEVADTRVGIPTPISEEELGIGSGTTTAANDIDQEKLHSLHFFKFYFIQKITLVLLSSQDRAALPGPRGLGHLWWYQQHYWQSHLWSHWQPQALVL